MNASRHPTDATLNSFALGKLDDPALEAVHQHLESCDECRRKVSSVSADSFLGCVRQAQGAMHSTFGQSLLDAARSKKSSKAAPTADTLPPGLAEHADYDVLKELGRGGMGVVYLAHNKLMGRDEVLKVMSRQIMEKPGVLDRFLREIRAVAKLRHPNIVTAYSAFRLEENLVFAMEYVDGYDLSKLVKEKGRLPVPHACQFTYQVALGLQNAHENGLIHRDIKPHNLMFARQGDRALVKILDFGLAKATREEKVDTALTSAGQALGTPDFIAPEQILDAQSADIRADIYSLGGTLFYLLTGRPPFQANSLYDLYQAHISRNIDPLNLIRPEVPSELAALVGKMMSKETKRRFQTPDEVARALAPFFKKGSATSIPRPASPVEATPPSVAPTPLVVAPTIPAPAASVEPQWHSLIAVTEPEKPTPVAAPPQPAKGSARKPPGVSRGVALASAWFSLLLVLGIMIYLKISDDGKVEVGAKFTPSKPAKKPSADPTKSGTAAQRPGSADSDLNPPVEPRKTFTNPLGMKLALIPAGEFMMGMSPETIRDLRKVMEGRPDVREELEHSTLRASPHLVRLTKPWLMGVTEVTIGQFKKFVEATGYTTQAEQYGSGNSEETTVTARVNDEMKKITWRTPGYSVTNDSPVTQVTWNDAGAFCNWLSEQEKLKPCYQRNANNSWSLLTTGDGYRLPTEAEWEYACRGGSSDEPTTREGIARLTEHAWFEGNRVEGVCARPVALKRPNGFGLFDMRGNVFEWCHDGYGPDYYRESPPTDPFGSSEGRFHAQRGGCWWNDPIACHSGFRNFAATCGRTDHRGFRVARVRTDDTEGSTVTAPSATSNPFAEGKGDGEPAPPGREAGKWVALFNGKDTNGWSAWDGRGPLSAAEASKIWSVRDGVLIGSGRQSHLFSPRGDYKDFRVRAEVKINGVGNSGLYFRAPSGPGLPAGYEAQIICTRNESMNVGALYGANAPRPTVPSSLPHPDTWFKVEAEAVGNRIQVWIDGQKTIDWADPKNSYSFGHFAIQVIDEQTRIQVRKLEVMELGDDRTARVDKPHGAPSDAVPYGDNVVKAFAENMSWHEAALKCRALGGRLVIVRNEEQNRIVTALARNAGLKHAWLGATDEVVEGRWVWVDGTPMTYQNWGRADGQPNNCCGGEHSLCLVADNGLWWDQGNVANNGWHPGFICEWD